jgi:hypothetical protein
MARIRQDFLSGVRSGVNGMPTFFINGVRHDGSYDLETLLTAIADAAGWRKRFAVQLLKRTVSGSCHVQADDGENTRHQKENATMATTATPAARKNNAAHRARDDSLGCLWTAGLFPLGLAAGDHAH